MLLRMSVFSIIVVGVNMPNPSNPVNGGKVRDANTKSIIFLES